MRRSTGQRPKPALHKHVRHRKKRRRHTASYAVVEVVLISGGVLAFILFHNTHYGLDKPAAAHDPIPLQTVSSTFQSAKTSAPKSKLTDRSTGVTATSSTTSTGASGRANAVNLPTSAMIDVPAQNQHPQLPNGCEVTSLSMLFDAIGHPVSKLTLAKEEPFDPTPMIKDKAGNIVSWGNPNVGFVGSPYVWSKGFGIYHGPIVKLIDKILPGEGLDLTKKPFHDLLENVAHGVPVEAWVNITLKPTNKYWVTWQSPEGPVHTTLDEHAVLIVGYSNENIYINNPFNGEKQEVVKRSDFIGAWKQMGEQAVTISPRARNRVRF